LLQINLSLISQESINLSGTVVDSVTGNSLPFAQISLIGTNLGTLSNEEGNFVFDIPSMFANDTVTVAYMGYKTPKFPISNFQFQKPLIIKLPPGQLHLSEVEIIGLTPEEVIRQVVVNIPKNYGETPVILTAFVRSQKIVDGKLAEFTEAIIENLKNGYKLYPAKQEENKRKQSNIPDLIKGRVISDTNLVNAMGDIGKSAGCLGCNFIHDFAEFYHQTVLDENLFRFYSFRMEELTGENGKVYHIWFDQRKGVKKTLWKGEMFVNAADFALLKIAQRPSFEAFDTYEKTKFKTSYFINNRYGWYKEMLLMDWTTTYSKRNDFYYLASIRVENWLTFVYPSTGKKTRFGHKNEVVITDASRDSASISNFKGNKSIGVNQRWDEVAGNTDDQFWINFNYLPIEEKLNEGLGKLKIKN
jgi:hypothetical protein